MAEVSNIPFK
jgi:hypothetical protein